MEDLIDSARTKHGTLLFPKYDIGVGDGLREYGEFSELELIVMLNFIRKGDCVIDIGANIGAFTVPLAKKVGIEGKVYGFEPQKFIYKILEKNINNNRLDNVRIFNYGLGSSNYNITLNNFDYSKLGCFGGIGFTKKYDNSFSAKNLNSKQKVQIKKIDDVLNIKQCNFVKIDVETMELHVLKGGRNFFSTHRPILWYENHLGPECKVNVYLKNIKYRLFWVATTLFNRLNFNMNLNKFVYGDKIALNVLAIPKEKFEDYKIDFLEEIIDEKSFPVKLIKHIL